MSKPKNENKQKMIGFRVSEDVEKRIIKQAKKRKQTKSEFVGELVIPALERAEVK